ncbi:MAG TPA: M23 family metallopeptidase [bacterium]|nr:M23 family metallopeptidase [bacterium]
MLKKEFTFVVIPPRTSKVIRLKIPKPLMLAGMALVAVFVVVAVVSIYRAVTLQGELLAYERLKSEYLRQQVGIKKVSNEVDRFKGEMDHLRELDYKLRLITDLEVQRPGPSIYGIGGFSEASDKNLVKQANQSGMDLLAVLNKDLSRLDKMVKYQEESFNSLKAYLADKQDLIQRTPYRWPVRGFLSSTFGPRLDPFTGSQRMHEGIDIVAPKGTPVKAPADGIVTFSGVDPSLGNMIVLDHGYGVITRYGHLNASLVREGQRVKRGDTIAVVGTTGRSTGPHLHYEIRINDVAINPLKLLIN